MFLCLITCYFLRMYMCGHVDMWTLHSKASKTKCFQGLHEENLDRAAMILIQMCFLEYLVLECAVPQRTLQVAPAESCCPRTSDGKQVLGKEVEMFYNVKCKPIRSPTADKARQES